MTQLGKLMAQGASAVIVYDTTASVISKHFGVPYKNFSIGSFLIYVTVGFLASRNRTERTAMAAVAAGTAVGLTDVTAGWMIGAFIGPGHLQRPLTPFLWAVVASGVTFSAILLAVIGYAIESLVLWRLFRRQ